MITPSRRDDTRTQRFVATAGSGMLLAALFVGLQAAPVPDSTSGRALIRRLDPLFVQRYAAPPRPVRDEREPPEPAEPEAAAIEQEVGSALDALVERFQGGEAIVSARPPNAEAAAGNAAPGISPEAASRFDALFGDAEAPPATVPGAPRGGGRRGGVPAPGLAIERSVRPAPPRSGDPAAPEVNVPVEAAGRRENVIPVTDVVLENHEPETFDRLEVDLLTDWMRAHRADLPVGVRVHLHAQPSFLTAAVPMAVDGRELELYLMYNPTLRELHIVMVEGDRSVYLIDRGFQAQSRSLREGIVQRIDGDIVAVHSRAGAASSERARAFYDIFLSWWNSAKRAVR